MARAKRRGWGSIRKLPSGRYQASYIGTDGTRYNGPRTFHTRDAATAWLSEERRRIDLDAWIPPTEERAAATTPKLTFGRYAEQWIEHRDLKPRTRDLYRDLLKKRVTPTLGDRELAKITPAIIRNWWAGLDDTTPTRSAQAYRLVRAIFGTAVDDELLDANPCRIRGAGQVKRARPVVLLTPRELDALAARMPRHLSFSVLLAAWCALRFGEFTELRRFDISADRSTVHVRRAVVHRAGTFEVQTTKSAAGHRDIAIPPHLKPELEAHLEAFVGPDPDALLFTSPSGGHLHATTFRVAYSRAAAGIGREGLRVHDLRHIGAVLAAQAGATTAELMGRLGHSSPRTAMIYQHVAAGRDTEIAARLSQMLE